MQVTTKEAMYRLLAAGRFGNTVRTWDTLAAIKASGYTRDISIRARERSNPVRLYHVEQCDLLRELSARGLTESDVIFCEPPPDGARTIQGELALLPSECSGRGADNLYLFASMVPKPMRFALEEGGKHYEGAAALLVLHHFVPHEDRQHLLELLQEFPGHVVEFSTFARRCGTLNRHTVIWECRKY